MGLKVFTLILIGFTSLVWLSNEIFAKTPQLKPLVLQINISHSRNQDQTSLIFREKTVDFVTNSFQMSSKEKKQNVRLGHFTGALNKNFRTLQRQIVSIKKNLESKKTTKNDQSAQMSPHAPVIHIGRDGKLLTFKEQDAHFRRLRNILSKARDRNWTCVSCAKYKRSGKSIIRTLEKKDRKSSSRSFSRKSLKCINLNKSRIECVDPQFGIFEL